MGRCFFWVMLCGFWLPLQAQAQAQAVEKPRLLFLDLNAILMDTDEVTILTKLVGAELGGYSEYSVITSSDLRQMAALEAEKQTMGCTDSSCLAELAGAMGARYVVFGDVGKLGEKIILTLNLFDSQEAKSVGRGVLKAKDMGEIADKLSNTLHQMLRPNTPLPVDESPVMQAAVTTPSEPAPPVKQAAQETTPPAPEESAPATVAPGNAFPWVRVLSASVVAAAGAGLALGWGLPAYLEVADKQGVVDAVKAAGDDVSQTQYEAMTQAEDAYLAGPMYGLIGGSVLAAVGVGYALWVTVNVTTEE